MKPDPTMRHIHHWRGVAFIRRKCACLGSLCGLIIALIAVSVLVRTSQQLSPDVPLKPKPSVVRLYKGSERAPEKLNQFETAFVTASSDGATPGAEVFSRFSPDALLVGPRLIAHSQALRAPPAHSPPF